MFRKKIKYIKKTVLSVMLCFCAFTFLLPATPTNAEDDLSKEITSLTENVVKIVVSCVDESGNEYYVHSGNGLIVATASSEQNILTDYNLIIPTEDELSQIRHGAGLGANDKLTTHIAVYFPSNITIDTTVISKNEQNGYALLKPAAAIQTSTYLHFGQTTDVKRKQDVYLIACGGEFNILGQNSISNTVPEIMKYSIESIERDPISLTINAHPSTGCAGGLLVNANGEVIGVMTSNGEDTLSIVPVESILILFQTLGVAHYNANPETDYNIAEYDIVLMYQKTLAEAQEDVMNNAQKYSKSSLAKYKTAIDQAIDLQKNQSITKDQYENAIEAINNAKKGLKPRHFVAYIIEGVLLLCIAFMLHMNIKQTLKGIRMKRSIEPPKRKNTNRRKQLAALIRIDSNEVIWITKKGLTIGKSQKNVDYCIMNNPSVSRLHATISFDDGHFYLMDNQSSNGTCINHSYIRPLQPQEIFDEDTITISDVVFTFRSMLNR